MTSVQESEDLQYQNRGENWTVWIHLMEREVSSNMTRELISSNSHGADIRSKSPDRQKLDEVAFPWSLLLNLIGSSWNVEYGYEQHKDGNSSSIVSLLVGDSSR